MTFLVHSLTNLHQIYEGILVDCIPRVGDTDRCAVRLFRVQLELLYVRPVTGILFAVDANTPDYAYAESYISSHTQQPSGAVFISHLSAAASRE